MLVKCRREKSRLAILAIKGVDGKVNIAVWWHCTPNNGFICAGTVFVSQLTPVSECGPNLDRIIKPVDEREFKVNHGLAFNCPASFDVDGRCALHKLNPGKCYGCNRRYHRPDGGNKDQKRIQFSLHLVRVVCCGDYQSDTRLGEYRQLEAAA